jgi:hypothetical protein
MPLPFSVEQFLGVFARYNEAIWPAQVVAYLLGLVAVVLVLQPTPTSSRLVSGTLAAFWLWTGIVYQGLFFSQINPAALAFAALFVLQGVLWLVAGVLGSRLTFEARGGTAGVLGWACVLYAMVLYPLLGALLGHGYPYAPTFAVTPCPLVIFTFGLLLWTRPPLPRYLLAIPLLWSLLGVSAAVTLGIREDVGLLVAGLLATALLLGRDRPIGAHPLWCARHA